MKFGFGGVSGMEMMLKSFGIDPEEIKAFTQGFVEHIKQWMQRDEARMVALEKEVIESRQLLNAIVMHLSGAGKLVAPSSTAGNVGLVPQIPLSPGENLNHG